MTDQLEHGINMANFINQIAGEHHLIDELVANAVEAASNRVTIIHRGSELQISNDGRSMDLHEIKSHLLTAYETGPEKSLDTNRGLGFIALYQYSKIAEIHTGNILLQVRNWNDINVRQTFYRPGFHIQVELTEEAQRIYSYHIVEEHLSKWIYWEDLSIWYGHDQSSLLPIGMKKTDQMEFKRHHDYNYANLRYSLDDFNLGKKVAVLYKLAQVEVYRLLPITVVSDLLKTHQSYTC